MNNNATQPKSTFTLAPDQLEASGLADCKPGDSYTALVTFTMSEDGAPGSFDVSGVSDVMPSEAEAPAESLRDESPPGEAGPADSTSLPAASDEENMLGYKRPKKDKPFPKVQGLRGF